ncbi:phosphocarrier protein [Natronincola peptidivorans]|uniref:Phosphocarrier protein HPr n=1 Tax=Natronincola peptidivorans TaxID=426128 RepID=A0A1I0G6S2_9FIRM|nr:HPr family phosphocarrier protein [Natronincola peptidivorans]SET65585.1 phosphocarrier protein [Natronincola peptidivorans]
MMEKTLEITTEVGLHARPAAALVKESNKYKSEIILVYNGKTANCKSIISIMSLQAKQGESVTFQITGEDEKEAIEGIVSLFNSNFNQ